MINIFLASAMLKVWSWQVILGHDASTGKYGTSLCDLYSLPKQLTHLIGRWFTRRLPSFNVYVGKFYILYVIVYSTYVPARRAKNFGSPNPTHSELCRNCTEALSCSYGELGGFSARDRLPLLCHLLRTNELWSDGGCLLALHKELPVIRGFHKDNRH
jgi:hypothetical protein